MGNALTGEAKGARVKLAEVFSFFPCVCMCVSLCLAFCVQWNVLNLATINMQMSKLLYVGSGRSEASNDWELGLLNHIH